jgi:hypothetical protein
MTRVGKHDPGYEGCTGTLFVYGESPVTSTKLNRWSGNLEAGFWLLQRILCQVFGGEGNPLLLSPDETPPLQVHEQETPNMTIRVSPGFLIGPAYLAGVSQVETVPATGSITAPVNQPRIDSLGILESGEWVLVTGTEAATPVAPNLPVDAVRLADIYLRVGATSILDSDDEENAYLIDRRPERKIALSIGSLATQSAEIGDSDHRLTLFQPAGEGKPVTNSSGTPEVIYKGDEDYWYPRQINTDCHLTFALPIQSPGTVVKSVKLIVYLLSSSESFNFALFRRSSAAPQTVSTLVAMAANPFTEETATLITGSYYSLTQDLDYTIGVNNEVWLLIRLRSGGVPQDCRLLGVEWQYEERRY